MYTFTRDELINKIYSDPNISNLNLHKEDAIEIIPMLVNNGYAVCIISGDFGDRLQLSILYAGDVENLECADVKNFVFADREYFDMLVNGDYKENEVITNE